ncbi:glycoside hydrolase [Marasmius fiardii PR-910]|nr:glycoside hydrolase [Marasmius fiardii PR-910]
MRGLSLVLATAILYPLHAVSIGVKAPTLHPAVQVKSHAIVANTTGLLDRRDVPGQKAVFMHVVSVEFGYTFDNWVRDLSTMKDAGIDAVALNIGKANDWQIDQVSTAYDAAASVGISTFISFDYSSFPCDTGLTITYFNNNKNKPAQFKVDGAPMISSFLGLCLGTGGWQSIKDQGAYLMPFIEVGNAQDLQAGGPWGFLQHWICWGCAWPQGNAPKTTDDDNWYLSNLGAGRFATTVSAWLYVHYPGNNRYLRGDDHLLALRWEQLISLRSNLRFVEYATWNDFGESHYVAPTTSGNQPAGTTWVNGFPHTAWLDMSKYYIQYFKSGSAPTVTTESIYFWLRPHPHNIQATGDSVGQPTGWDWARDSLYAVVFCRTTGGSCSAMLKVGNTSQNYNNLQAGPNKLELPLNGNSFGTVTVQVFRDGGKVIDLTPSADTFQYRNSAVTYNFNAFVGSASKFLNLFLVL